jgi:hypothetical protein
MSNEANLNGVVTAALEIAAKRSETLARLRAAVKSGNDAEGLKIARELCGVDNEQKSDRTHPRVN